MQTKRSDVNVRMRLSRSQSLRVAAVLEDFHSQLALLAVSFTVKLENNPHSLHEKEQMKKLIQDCHALSELLATICEELEENQTFTFLLKKIEDEEERKQMMVEHIRRVTKADFREKQEFCTKLEEELQNKHSLFERLVGEYAKLEVQQEDQNEKNKMIKRDKEDKLQMLQKEASDKEEMLNKQIKLVKERMERERHSHNVSMKFLQNQQEEMKQLEGMWEERTRTLRQAKAQELNDVRCKITLRLDRLMEMRRKFRVMEQVVMEDKEEQEKLQQEQHLIKAATKVQAFWRGCMVRKGLGIYKKTEEDKKSKKKDVGKKGKKKKK
ncbi:dynein regulatory complex protein 9 [Boleophthalmus pectinirostris]|uniref:dynein regulatory complex protein 9 n=1 Tax=Boleophthalmus pectinirostris TaxID=150288 RepID=UPI00242CF287|nr:dynein regulatory complex protein 9 [Boleophthalmus pectinirostris]XP_055019372.1 dynein regulatory complex protein 9 [Boleophthalmus pectinirostris]XP_055019373.1 dynein regulatory complex protein 9 [Boleophthalmus pectinirostris]